MALNLHPAAYELHDHCGKVDAESFSRAVGKGLCVLELREKPEWQRMREMQAQIELLLERTGSAAREEMQKELTEKVLQVNAETQAET